MSGARVRVISDNDYSGDPDGLVQLAQHALSPSVELGLVIGSHLRPDDPFDPSGRSADNAASAAREVLALCGRSDVPVIAGSNLALAAAPEASPAARAIVAEALREDPRPLYLCAGAGLTEVAAALRLEPAIASRMTLVWIGGPEHPGLASPPPGAMPIEYNLLIDVPAAAEVFASELPIEQFARDSYRQVLASTAELRVRMHGAGALGRHLFDALDAVSVMGATHGMSFGETYALGDSPLVLATALLSAFEPDTSSSRSVRVPRPGISEAGQYVPGNGGPDVRVYTAVDTRLLLEDLYAKLSLAGLSAP
ncbi:MULTISPECIES: nucleoside hydrolase [unclassified Rathayibacter]|uniref:nucleoside hydrolase n=1 Tax=unclassified Rathayibacter TaxID=2609250 RepID=UPI0006FE15B6|nr:MULTISPECIES: nucleoside hydrolase [unclassified Rathayibacter]KQQ03641.1 twin-arginine translocation pathway signal protein [Rathayibacter sp. Leaf294]KQS12097.1 twin-arginine translocation pathway signal protein [Rathayibacter sp. Leaf185]